MNLGEVVLELVLALGSEAALAAGEGHRVVVNLSMARQLRLLHEGPLTNITVDGNKKFLSGRASILVRR